MKDKNNFCFKVNLVCQSQFPNQNFRDNYIGETDRRIEHRITDVNKRDENSLDMHVKWYTITYDMRILIQLELISCNFIYIEIIGPI